MKILLTGGAGYIGSHTAVELLARGHEVVIVDDLSNSNIKVLGRIEAISGKEVSFYKLDVCDEGRLDAVFEENRFDACIHFAGYKAVGESVHEPLMYYQNNLNATMTLIKVMDKHGVDKIVFSSSATVYESGENRRLEEGMRLGCTNPYGWTKFMSEQILIDVSHATGMRSALLRYFNPIGAHSSGLIGEDPKDIPNNLMPFVSLVAVGKLSELCVFGDDYDTPDGTGVRDYIHVVDLAVGHVLALEYITEHEGVLITNLGTGRGYSVLELVRAFEEANGVKVPYRITERRPGDIAECYAATEHAKNTIGFEAKRGIVDMCRDAWNWQRNNPDGYR